jgi:hypothetical protein
VPNDVLEHFARNQVVRYKPGAQATFRHPDGTTSRVVTNAQGWNSRHAAYSLEKARGVTRTTVIGDSYVHGSFIDRELDVAARLEDFLKECGAKAEVYRFGMDGTPLSRYLNMLRNEILAYIVGMPLIHNDFEENYRFLKTRYASCFMKFEREPSGAGVREIAPASFEAGMADMLRRSAGRGQKKGAG